jgi:hypothetical protein
MAALSGRSVGFARGIIAGKALSVCESVIVDPLAKVVLSLRHMAAARAAVHDGFL